MVKYSPGTARSCRAITLNGYRVNNDESQAEGAVYTMDTMLNIVVKRDILDRPQNRPRISHQQDPS